MQYENGFYILSTGRTFPAPHNGVIGLDAYGDVCLGKGAGDAIADLTEEEGLELALYMHQCWSAVIQDQAEKVLGKRGTGHQEFMDDRL